MPDKQVILSQFSRFGKVINVCMRPSANINEVLKSFFLVEMEFREQAIEARKYFYIDDKDGQRRGKLGDKKAEINVLVKSTL